MTLSDGRSDLGRRSLQDDIVGERHKDILDFLGVYMLSKCCMYSAHKHDKRALPIKHILLTRKFGFQRERSELNRVSDDKSEKEMQFL